MERLATYLTLDNGARANQEIMRRSQATAKAQPTGSFGRRMSKRYAFEQTLYASRQCGGGSGSGSGNDRIEELAELHDDSVQLVQPEDVKETVGKAAEVPDWVPDWAQTRKSLHDCSPIQAENVKSIVEVEAAVPSQAQTRQYLQSKFKEFGLSAETSAVERSITELVTPNKQDSRAPSTSSKAVVVAKGLGSPQKLGSLLGRTSSKRMSLIPPSPRKKLSSRNIKLPRPLSWMNGPKTIVLEDTEWEMMEPPSRCTTGMQSPIPPVQTSKTQQQKPSALASPPKIPARITSKNFSLLHAKDVFLFDRLPKELRKRVYRVLVVAEHEVVICADVFCGLCVYSTSKQPAITRTNRAIRAESLPIFYGENKFVLRGVYEWASNQSPIWLRTLRPETRDLIEHVEVCTRDIASAVCMMATLGFRLSHRLPRSEHYKLMMEGTEIWMTFTAIKKAKAGEEFHLWDSEEPLRNRRDTPLAAEVASVASVSTGILDFAGDSMEDVIRHGEAARQARGRLVLVDDEEESGSMCTISAEQMSLHEQVAEPRPVLRYSIGTEMVRRVQ